MWLRGSLLQKDEEDTRRSCEVPLWQMTSSCGGSLVANSLQRRIAALESPNQLWEVSALSGISVLETGLVLTRML
jgi:hypothetical protein